MGHLEYLTNLISPLGVYDLEGTFNRGELIAIGSALDQVMEQIDDLEKEMSLATANDWGVDKVANLLTVSPVASTTEELAKAFATLLRIGRDSATLQAINDTVSGCGVTAKVTELNRPNYVQVEFPNLYGIPEQYKKIESIINDILPAQVMATYYFRYLEWEDRDTWTWEDGSTYSWYMFATEE